MNLLVAYASVSAIAGSLLFVEWRLDEEPVAREERAGLALMIGVTTLLWPVVFPIFIARILLREGWEARR